MQDAFVKVWRKAGSYDPARGSLDNWVCLIARNLAIEAIRRRAVEARMMAQVGEGEEATDTCRGRGPWALGGL